VADEKGIDLIGGIIATGDQFVADESRKDWIKTTFEADAIEMEGAAVAVVCDAFKIPFFIMRSISDTADEGAVEDFDEFLKHSSQRSSSFVISMLDKIK